jgi:hypothetical protein
MDRKKSKYRHKVIDDNNFKYKNFDDDALKHRNFEYKDIDSESKFLEYCRKDDNTNCIALYCRDVNLNIDNVLVEGFNIAIERGNLKLMRLIYEIYKTKKKKWHRVDIETFNIRYDRINISENNILVPKIDDTGADADGWITVGKKNKVNPIPFPKELILKAFENACEKNHDLTIAWLISEFQLLTDMEISSLFEKCCENKNIKTLTYLLKHCSHLKLPEKYFENITSDVEDMTLETVAIIHDLIKKYDTLTYDILLIIYATTESNKIVEERREEIFKFLFLRSRIGEQNDKKSFCIELFEKLISNNSIRNDLLIWYLENTRAFWVLDEEIILKVFKFKNKLVVDKIIFFWHRYNIDDVFSKLLTKKNFHIIDDMIAHDIITNGFGDQISLLFDILSKSIIETEYVEFLNKMVKPIFFKESSANTFFQKLIRKNYGFEFIKNVYDNLKDLIDINYSSGMAFRVSVLFIEMPLDICRWIYGLGGIDLSVSNYEVFNYINNFGYNFEKIKWLFTLETPFDKKPYMDKLFKESCTAQRFDVAEWLRLICDDYEITYNDTKDKILEFKIMTKLDRVIDLIKARNFSKIRESNLLEITNFSYDDDDICPICLDQINSSEYSFMSECKHSFCPDCINRFMKENPSCPYCSKSIRLDKCKLVKVDQLYLTVEIT